ncbi:cell division protein FtsA [Vulcaniibacterium thermophilum]|uniref:cell division protein FtsA n=1 Tax=Vulcaniibacterium thermophilum TaxID=1169913 RepID=UPI0036225365
MLDDSQEGIRNPVGMTGLRALEVHAHLVVCAQSAAANITKCVQRCGLQVDDLILSVLASSTAVLTADEKELGVVLVDIGAGTTDIAVFVQGAIAHSASLPIAGDKVTEDSRTCCARPRPRPSRSRCAMPARWRRWRPPRKASRCRAWATVRPRRMPRHSLAQAVQARYEEIFEMVQAELRRSGVGFRAARARRHGADGGASKMEGVVELAEEMLQMPVRVGIPQHVTASAKWWATRCTPPASACC